MSWNNIYRNIEQLGLFIGKWVAIISGILAVGGWIVTFLQWGNKGPFVQTSKFLQEKAITFWLIAITAMLIMMCLWMRKLHRKFVSGFTDKFKGNLDSNWDFTGQWRVPDPGTLLVTGPDEGCGITKLGTYWENYTFTFRAKIINECIGVIVRAQDLNNYYMFQIRADKLRPHRRVAVPIIVENESESQSATGIPGIQTVQYLQIWQTENNSPKFSAVPISPKLDDWFSVKIFVKGQSVKIYINEELVFHQNAFLQISAGKVGFRNHCKEEAQVKDVRVILG